VDRFGCVVVLLCCFAIWNCFMTGFTVWLCGSVSLWMIEAVYVTGCGYVCVCLDRWWWWGLGICDDIGFCLLCVCEFLQVNWDEKKRCFGLVADGFWLFDGDEFGCWLVAGCRVAGNVSLMIFLWFVAGYDLWIRSPPLLFLSIPFKARTKFPKRKNVQWK
jgi:hypothetical protein